MKKTMDVGDYDVMVLKAELGTVLDELVENLEKYVCAVRIDVGMGVASSPQFFGAYCAKEKRNGEIAWTCTTTYYAWYYVWFL